MLETNKNLQILNSLKCQLSLTRKLSWLFLNIRYLWVGNWNHLSSWSTSKRLLEIYTKKITSRLLYIRIYNLKNRIGIRNENYEFIKFNVPLNIKMCDTHQWISLNLKQIWQLYEISPPLGVDGGEMNFSGYVG